MKITGKTIIAGIFLLFLFLFFFWFLFPKESGKTAEVLQDGTPLYTFSLKDAPDQTIRVEYEGRYNIIQIEGGQIRVLEADCPDQICVQMGWLHSAAPIVCLPNRLVIQYKDGEEALDAVAN